MAFQYTLSIDHSTDTHPDSSVYFGYNPTTDFGSKKPWIGSLFAHNSTNLNDAYWSLNVEATYYNGV